MHSLQLPIEPKALAVAFSADVMRVALTDGRSLTVPLAWFPRLAHATPAEQADYQLLGDGEGIHWPQVDEDVSVAGLLAGQPSVEVKRALVG